MSNMNKRDLRVLNRANEKAANIKVINRSELPVYQLSPQNMRDICIGLIVSVIAIVVIVGLIGYAIFFCKK